MSEVNLFIAVKAPREGSGPCSAAAILVAHGEEVKLDAIYTAHSRSTSFSLRSLNEYLDLVFPVLGDGDFLNIYINSSYAVDGLTSWIHKWKANGWRTANGTPVKQREVWEKAYKRLKPGVASLRYQFESNGPIATLMASLTDQEAADREPFIVDTPISTQTPGSRAYLPGQGVW